MGKRDTLKGAIVGCGSLAQTPHIPIFRALKDVEIVALCDKRENVALQTARRWGIPIIYVDFSQVLADKDLDFLDICSPPQTYFSLSMQAIKAGLHVLVEKPMARGVSEADKMISISKKNKIKLCVVHNFLFSPTVQKAKPLVDAGAIGDLVSVEVMILARRDGIIRRKDHWCTVYQEAYLANMSLMLCIWSRHS